MQGQQPEKLIEGKDYYINKDGNLVFTREYHLKRGYCCNSRCLHCPYREKEPPNASKE